MYIVQHSSTEVGGSNVFASCILVFIIDCGRLNFTRTNSVAAKDQILGWTLTGGRTSSIIHKMKAKNLRIQKLRDAGTKKLYKWRYRTVTMATFLK